MKWIIINHRAGEAEAASVLSFLSLRQVEAACYEYNPLDTISARNISSVLQSATHCVLIRGSDKEYESVLQYIAGFAAGRKLPFFVTGIRKADSSQWFLENTCCVDSVALFLEIIEDKLGDYAEQEGKAGAHRELFDRGIPKNPDCFALHIAAGHHTIVSLFIEAGVDINCRNSEGVPMLCIAARHEQPEMACWLIKHGIDIDAISADRGYSAVMDAAWKNCYEIVKILVDAGANLNFISRDGQTALILAVGTGNDAICELLTSHGADPLIKDHMGMSALSYAQLFKKEKLVSLFTVQKE